MLGKKLLYNTALLTVSSLVMSCIGMAFNVWLVGRVGTAGIGLYELVISVVNLCATFAISGIRFATTRLISEEIGLDNTEGIRGMMRRCLGYGAFFGAAAGAVIYFLAEPIGFLWIGDARTVRALRLCALSMPCISMGSSLSGYFTACGRVWKSALVHFTEQLVCIAAVAFFLFRVSAGDIEKSCTAVIKGRVTADVVSFLLMLLAYVTDRARHYAESRAGGRPMRRILRIAVPLAVSAYARSALTTFQHLLVPRGLREAGYSADSALSGYGIIQGMVLPILMFPSCIVGVVSMLIVPELTESQVQNDGGAIRSTVRRLLGLCISFSLAVALFMLVFADKLGIVIYGSREAGHYIRLLAPLVPLFYTDMTVDGCLKGLGQQVWCMGINVLESLVGLFLIRLYLPLYALKAYIFIIYFSEIFNLALSAGRLCYAVKHNVMLTSIGEN